jgi:cobalt-zinc-cadmium efflux system outer membrane protein
VACATQIESARSRLSASAVVDLAAVLKLARESAPRLSVERQAVAGAEASVTIAGALPNPILSYGRYRPIHNATTLFEGSRRSRARSSCRSDRRPALGAVEKAERDLDAARARVASGASSLAAEAGQRIRRCLLAAQERAALLSTGGDELARLRNVGLPAGRSSGVASRYDVLRLEIELAGHDESRGRARRRLRTGRATLPRCSALQDWRPKATGSLRPLPQELFDRKGDGALESPR